MAQFTALPVSILFVYRSICHSISATEEAGCYSAMRKAIIGSRSVFECKFSPCSWIFTEI